MKREQTRVEPSLQTTDPRFVPTRGSDVQATWRKHGWVPPSLTKTPPPPEKSEPIPAKALPPLKTLRMVSK